jgi:Spy/CpxP family protein refolding chaperone
MNDRSRALAVLTSVFLAGCIVGAFGFFLWTQRQPETIAQKTGVGNIGPGGRGGEQRERMSQWFAKMLKLTPEQNRLVSQIMDQHRHQLDDLDKKYTPIFQQAATPIRAEYAPKIKAVMDDTNRKISDILNADQRAKYSDWLNKMAEERKKRGPRNGRGFGAPPPGRPSQF